MRKAPVVALAREIDPFRMAKLVAHEVEVAFAACRDGHQTDHLMQGDGALDDHVFVAAVHAPIHFLVGQPEHERLVAHERLIVALAVGDVLLARTAGNQLVIQAAHVPLAVLLFPDGLDEIIRQAHAQAVVKPNAALFDRQTHARHAAHLLRHAERAALELVRQLCRQLQIGDGLHVRIHGEILPIIGKRAAQTVIEIDHTGHAVKAEAVEMIFLQPEAHVGEQEMHHAVFAVVKDLAAPSRMIARAAGLEELIVASVKAVDALGGVFHRMGMHQIEQHAQPQRVRLVNQRLEVVRCAVPRGRGEEIADLIAERRVIRMLHNGHQLHGVVAVLFDPRQNIAHELQIRAHALFLGRHADMRLVNQRRHIFLRPKFFIRPDKFLPRIPDGGAEIVRLFVLHNIGRIERNAVFRAARAGDGDLHLAAVLERAHAGDLDFPISVAHRLHRMAGAVPVVEIANQVHGRRAGRPLAVDPAALDLVEAVIQMAAGKLRQRLSGGKQLLFALFEMADAFVQIAFKGGKIGVILYDFKLADLLLCGIAHQKSSSPVFFFLRLYPIFPSISTLLYQSI